MSETTSIYRIKDVERNEVYTRAFSSVGHARASISQMARRQHWRPNFEPTAFRKNFRILEFAVTEGEIATHDA